MAFLREAFLSAVVQFAFDKVASPIVEGFGRLLGVDIDKDREKISRTLKEIQDVLNDAEERQINEMAVKMWLSDFRAVAYDADDVLDEVATEALRQNQVLDFISFPKNFVFKFGLAPKIKEITERLDEIAKKKDNLGLRRTEIIRERPQTSSLIDESCVFGRTDDTNKIVELLVSDDGNDVYSVIPIVGMGGLGKTTLAQLVYNDEKVKDLFELRMWVCVSDDFDLRRLTKSIIESATKEPAVDLTELDGLQKSLQETLKGKRFLLVLDDVWNETQSYWEMLCLPFRVGAKGSKIIVTTRSEIVSSIMGTTTPHRLESLSDDDCWSLFKQRAFINGNSDAYPHLAAIGKKILKKCQGLPLAAKTLGGLLHSKVDENEWDMILKSDVWELGEDENGIMPALRLSYNHLPAHLRQCFAYCSIFPKDYEFEKENLVLLWIAEGFVHSKGRKSMEDVGGEYFDDLLLRSFFQYSKIKYKSQFAQFVMHDLIHDLAQFISGEICVRMEGDKSCNISEKTRHASLFLENSPKSTTLEAFHTSKGLRTFMLRLRCDRIWRWSWIRPPRLGRWRQIPPQLWHGHQIPPPQDLIVNLRCLRVLDLSHVTELPDSIGDLIHLRYLNLSLTRIKRLPESTSSLYNLQVLNLEYCKELLELPKEMKNLIYLRHLNLFGCWDLVSMPPGVGRLTCLQTLNRFVASEESECGIQELKDMIHLRGALWIERLEDVVNVIEAKEANMKNEQHLHKLALKWSHYRCYFPDGNDGGVLEALQPHTNLKELEIHSYCGVKFPSWMGDSSFSHLMKIVFRSCNYCKFLPPLGQLPLLKHLSINGMNGLEVVGREFCGDGKVKGFPSMETLEFQDMKDLKEWSGVEDGEFPCLRMLIIGNCPEMRILPRFPSLCDLELRLCDEKILSSLPYLTSLSSLRISEFKELEFLPEGLLHPLNALKKLTIKNCLDLKSLPKDLQNLASLEELHISCRELVSFPVEGLPTGLKRLTIFGCKNLQSLPMGLQCLTSLEYLKIMSCHQLASLPEEGLPAQLRSLIISYCELLEKRCKVGGEDWPKIAHIPHLRIDLTDKI